MRRVHGHMATLARYACNIGSMIRTSMNVETTSQALLLFVSLFLGFLALLHIAAKQHGARRSVSKQQHQQPAGDDHGRLPLPPSPPGLPVIGHLHLVGFLPHVSLRGLVARYGRDGLMLVRLGSLRAIVVSSPRAAEAVTRTHDHLLASRPPSTAALALLKGPLDIAFAAYGDNWRQAKKLVTKHMLTVRKVQSYRAGREEAVRLAMGTIGDAAAAGRAVDMSDVLYGFTTDIMCRAVSGRFFNVGGRSRLFRELLDATAALIGFNLDDYFPWLLRVGIYRRAICSKADKVRKRWDDLLDRVIDDHEGKMVQQQEPDFVEVLLSHQQEYGLTRDHLKAMLINIFFGGTDTSYVVLEFAMAELLRHPHVMSRLQAEIRSGVPLHGQHSIVTEDDLTGMAYLKAVISETLRLHPPAPLLAPHLSITDVHIHGYMIPAEVPVLVNAWALGRDASVWEDAEEFKPERFLETGSDAAINFKGTDFQFLPFGAGRRICPGINFSIATLEIMLANLVYHFDWEVPTGTGCIDMTEVFWLTAHRKEKLILVPKVHVM